MLKDHIQLLFEYDRWANNRVLQAVSALRDEQFTRDLGGSFRSVRDTLVHIISGEWGWLAYWKEPSPSPAFVKDLRDRRDSLFNPDKFPNITEVKSKWAEVEKEQREAGFGSSRESTNEGFKIPPRLYFAILLQSPRFPADKKPSCD